MKLESTLNRKSGFLHVASVIDVVLLLLIFFLLQSRFTVLSGFQVELPQSATVLRPTERAHVVTIAAGSEAAIYLNGQGVDRGGEEGLITKLEAIREQSKSVVIHADRLAAHGLVVEVANDLMVAGYDVAIATASESGRQAPAAPGTARIEQ